MAAAMARRAWRPVKTDARISADVPYPIIVLPVWPDGK
jgi:hypothetical protein